MQNGPSPAPKPERIQSIDAVRGAVMLLMVLDHVRVYSAVPAFSSDPAIFLTRWITHFCAPAFVFLAGTAAALRDRRHAGGASPPAGRLVVRGVWLILLELTVVRLAWTFNLAFDRYMLAGVLWAIGWSMIALAVLRQLPTRWLTLIAILIVAGHNLTGELSESTRQALQTGNWAWLARIIYFGGPASENFFVLYSLVPWIGVMALGYAFAAVMRRAPEERRSICFWLGCGLFALFVALRAFHLYGDRPWVASAQTPGWMAFLGTTKYPASLQFLLMTLGPMLIAVAAFERRRSRVGDLLATFGKVPLFFYVLHIPLIHLTAIVISLVRTPQATGWLFGDHPVNPGAAPDGYLWSLPLVYAVSALVIALLYVPCRWMAARRARG